MGELQRIYPRLEQERIALYAVSYDSEEVLQRFADRAGIAYPLLSDSGSQVIQRLGLLNTRVREEHDATGIEHIEKYEGVSYPIAFVLDVEGIVRERRFHTDYRVRESGSALVAMGFELDWPRQSAKVASTPVVRVEVACEDRRFDPFQMLWCQVRLQIADGWHVYGDPAPPCLTPVHVAVSPQSDLIVGELELPPPSWKRRGQSQEVFPVYHGETVARFPLTVATDDLRKFEVGGSVTLQACLEESCLSPETVPWSVTLLPRV